MLKKDAMELINYAYQQIGNANNGYGVDGRKKQLQFELRACVRSTPKSAFKTPKKVTFEKDIKYSR
jgi:hypothetical protein